MDLQEIVASQGCPRLRDNHHPNWDLLCVGHLPDTRRLRARANALAESLFVALVNVRAVKYHEDIGGRRLPARAFAIDCQLPAHFGDEFGEFTIVPVSSQEPVSVDLGARCFT